MEEEAPEHHRYGNDEEYRLEAPVANMENVPVGDEYMAMQYDQAPANAILSQPLKWRKIVATDGAIPRPRHGHKSIIVNDTMLVWGGGNEGIIDEISVYNIPTNRWTTPNTRGDKPPGTAAAGLTKGPGSRIYTFGGMIEYGKYSNDLYELDLTRWEWRKLRARARPGLGQQAVQPCARLGHSLVSDSKGMLYVFGGLTNGSDEARFNKPKYLNDFYCVNVSQTHMNQGVVYWEQPRTTGPQPPCRESHTAVVLETATRREMILYGGMDGNRLGDIWVMDLNKMEWQEKLCFGSAPLPRSLHCAALLEDKMYIYGGWVPIGELQPDQRQDARWKCTNSLGVLNCSTWTWELANLECMTETFEEGQETFPHARSGHSASVFGKRLYVWSGRDGYRKSWNNQVCCRDFWYLETEKPAKPVRLNLGKANLKALDVFWSPVKNAEAYLLQILKNPPIQLPRKLVKPAPKPVKPIVKKDEDMPENFMEDVAEEKEQKEEPQQPEMEEKEVEEEWLDVAVVKGTNFTVTEYYEKNSELPRLGESYIRTDIHDSYQLQRKVHEIEQGTGYRIRVAGINLLGIGEFSDPVMFKTILPGFPGAPSQIKIQKVAEGAQICWIPPAIPNGRIVEYSVYLAMKPGDRLTPKHVSKQSASPSMPGVEFERVYVGDRTECFIDHKVILEAHVESNPKNKPAVIFRIAAKNEKGYGPATQVRWLQDWRTDLDPNHVPIAGPPRLVGQPMKTVVRAPGTPVTVVRAQNPRSMGQGPVVARGPQMVYRAAQPTTGVRYQPYNASGAQGSVAPRIVAIPPHRQLAGQQVRIQPHPGQNANQQR